MRIDLHTHSTCSDGTDSPADLVAAASGADLNVVALTDHDTFAGWDEARDAAARLEIGLVLGAEVSCRLAGTSVHMLAYLPDPTDGPLQEMLERIREGRNGRVPLIVERLRRHGIAITVNAVAAQSHAATSLGRPHIADAMIAAGYVRDRTEAFDRWLAEGKPAYVTRYAPEPTEVVTRIVAAGGVPVLAHARGRASRDLLTDDVIGQLAETGLAGIEVDHRDHDEAVRRELRGLAAGLDLVVTGSSDYHGHGKSAHDLGCCTTEPAELERLLIRAGDNAERAGRTVPVAFLP